MQEFLHHPAVTSWFAPFVAALIVAELMQRPRLSGLVVIAAYCTTLYLGNGLSFEPLTAPSKILLLGLIASFLAVVPDFVTLKWTRPALAAFAAVAALWAGARILQQQEVANMLLWGAGSAAYAAWLVYWTSKLAVQPVRAGSAGLALGVGTGLAVLLGASASLGSGALALGAAAAAFLAIQMITNSYLSCGHLFTFPLSLIAALTGTLGVLGATLPWYALIPLALVPLAAIYMPVPKRPALWVQSLSLSVAPLLLGAVAVYLSWQKNGLPPL